ncbi:MAG: tRNA (adenosine(37)-N6)-threonylcarbamoyltransferase complex ATPase subunit type 1 TsaE [Chloroflexota bacterium]|nr:tRNA (adenosine(37)-N6)-threonylcarbamoyltransferase complex ATPase subunit type 1 TsaE [Chloroflexota bacterium]
MHFRYETFADTETEALGETLGRLLEPGAVLALIGDLGAGKTTLTRGIAQGLGIDDPVTSPTFILVAEYRTAGGWPFYHADSYRLNEATAEALDIGLDELMGGDGICVVEWAERIESLFPEDYLRISIDIHEPGHREFFFSAKGPGSSELLARLQHNLVQLPAAD